MDEMNETWWWQHSAVGKLFVLFFHGEANRVILQENLLDAAKDLRLPPPTAITTGEWF